MKTNSFFPWHLLNREIYQRLILMMMVSFYSFSFGQGTELKSSLLYPGFGIGFGFFNPAGVNQYIEDHLPGNYYMEYGTTDMFVYYEAHATLTYKIKWFDVTGLVEYAYGPKLIVISGGSNQFYGFSRFSPGILTNFYIPMASGRHAIFLGGGAQYHIMKFEEYGGGNIGFRLNGGISLQFKKINLQPYLAFNLANATDENTDEDNPFELNYTGGQIGVNISFHPPMANQ